MGRPVRHSRGRFAAAERAGDRFGVAQMLSGIGAAHRATGQPELAVATQREVLEIFRGEGDDLGIATALNNLGAALRDAGSHDEALVCGWRAHAMEYARGEPGNVAICLRQIALDTHHPFIAEILADFAAEQRP